MNEELRSCPFCGSNNTNIWERMDNEDKRVVYDVSCHNCGARGPSFGDNLSGSRLSDKIAAGNKRAAIDKAKEVMG